MSKNFKIKDNKKTKQKKFEASNIKIGTAIVSAFVVLVLICGLAVSGLGEWVDNNYNKPAATPTPVVDNTVIEFGDENLEKFIKDKLKVKEDHVTVNHVKSITNGLHINTLTEIKSFKGLEMFPSLTAFSVSDAKILDFSALADAKLLTNINLYDCDISEATSEKENKYLTDIYIEGTLPNATLFSTFSTVKFVETRKVGIKDLSGFGGMPGLTNLDLFDEDELESFEGIAAIEKLSTVALGGSKIKGFGGVKNAKALTSITADDTEIKSVAALKDCATLKLLHITNSKLDNPSDIGKIKTLTELNIEKLNEGKVDTSFIDDLSALEVVSVSGISMSSLSVLKNKPNLKLVYAADCGLTNINGIRDAVNLETLDISNNNISLTTALSKLSKLKYLDISDNNIRNLNDIKDIITLMYLDVSGNKDITKLNNLDSMWLLEELYANDCSINSIDIGECTSLMTLSLKGNKISYVEDIARLGALTTINIADNEVTELPSFESLSSLSSLYASGNNISDISALEKATTLTALDLNNNKITDGSKLKYLVKLTKLDIGSNSIKDISFVSSLTKLTTFNAENNGISNIDKLSTITSLQNVDLSDNELESIKALEKLTKMESLDVASNKIADITPLLNKTYLKKLDLTSNMVTEVATLSSCTALKELKMKNNQVTNFEPLKNLSLTVKEIDGQTSDNE